MSQPHRSTVRRVQIVGVSIAGAIAVLCYAVSMVTAGAPSDALRAISFVAAAVCAVIGVTFTFAGTGR